MQISNQKQNEPTGNSKNQLGYELSSMGQPSNFRYSKKERQSVALVQTKRKITTLESMATNQKRQTIQTNLANASRQSTSFNQLSQNSLSDDKFYDANSYFDEESMNPYGLNRKSNYNTKQQLSRQNVEEGDQSDPNNSNDSDQSFYSIDDNSPDLQYDRTKECFFNHTSIKAKSELGSPKLSKQTNLLQLSKVQKYAQDNELNRQSRQNTQQRTSQDDKTSHQRRSSSVGKNKQDNYNQNNNKFDILQIVNMVQPQNESYQMQKSNDTEENISQMETTANDLKDQFQYQQLNDSQRTESEVKKYINFATQRSSCINSFNSKNMSHRPTNDTLDTSQRIDQSFLRDEDRVCELDTIFNTHSNMIEKQKSMFSDQNAGSNILHNRNTIQCMSNIEQNTLNRLQNQQLQNQFNKQTNYYRQKKNAQSLFTLNRILEIKRRYQSQSQEEKALKKFTLNLTFILNCEIQSSKLSLRLFQTLHIWSLTLRYYFYFFGLYMMSIDSRYSYYFLPMVILPRIFYILSMYNVIFSYQNNTKSYRQVSQIINNAFGPDDYFQIMNMNQLLTSDSYEKLSWEKIFARFKFIFLPSEINILSLKGIDSSQQKKQEVWYISNYILISIEYMTVYIIMIFFSIYNSQFKKQFQLDNNFSLNIYTFSFMFFAISLNLFLVFNFYYLRKGNIKLRKDNRTALLKAKKTFS